MGKLSQLVQLRPPDWNAVKRQYDSNKHTTQCKVFAGLTGLTALAMASALKWPANPVVQFFGGYALVCFFPALNLLQLRRWNRTLAFPAALIYIAAAALTLLVCFSFSNILAALLLSVSFMIGATSDRLSFVYKWKTPFDHMGIAGLAILLYLVVYFVFMFFVFSIFIGIFILALIILIIRSLFGRRRYGRWF